MATTRFTACSRRQFELRHTFDDSDGHSEAASDLDDGEALLAASSRGSPSSTSSTETTPDYETFEQMHYVCFHYEFEHGNVDVDQECTAGGCPSRPHGNTTLPAESFEPGQFARIGVVFFDERAGRALVRQPQY